MRGAAILAVSMKQILKDLQWIEELLPPDVRGIAKYGGTAYYQDMMLVLILVEQPKGVYEHKGVAFPFQLWNGCILPIEQIKQSAFFLKYTFLENHPANKNWLYIPAESENFEDEVKLFLREISKRNPLLGIPVKPSRSAPAKSEKADRPKTARRKKTPDKKRENAFMMSMMAPRTKKP